MPKPFTGISIPLEPASPIKRRFSVTQDVVAFRRCARQYGTFNVQKYAPAHQTQLYFGTILHQVLDRCHSHFHGHIDPSTAGQLPDAGALLSDQVITDFFNDAKDARQAGDPAPDPPSDIVRYFVEVEDGLKSKGIRAVTPDLRLKAIRILQYFNTLEGPVLYQRVVDTEHRLQADQTSHILHGVVDLLIDTSGSDAPQDCEMWDYKGSSRIGLTPTDLQSYEFQMRVYARLYQLKHGVLPRRTILYFLNELDGPTCPTSRPVNAILEVSLDPQDIQSAMAEFAATVGHIENARAIDQWLPAVPGQISEQDCAICDLRWDCPTPNNGAGVALRFP